MKRFKIFRGILLFWCLFIGVGALWGGIAMFIKPDGSLLQMDTLLPYFQVLPFADVLFQDYIFSGVMLILINGVTNIVASILIIRKKRAGFALGTIFGFTLMLWIILQFFLFPINALDIIFFTCGVLQLLCGYVALVSYNQVFFQFSESVYQNIGKNKRVLVVYFSRMQFTKRIAYIKADKEGADIVELRTKERTEGTIGFWWCGRFGMHVWPMEIEPLDVDLNAYDKIIVVSPIWVFRMCGPIRDFVTKNQDILKSKQTEAVFNHFNPWLPKGAVKELRRYGSFEKIESKTTWLGHTFHLGK